MGHARSTGELSQQGLLPEVYRTACTRGCAHQNDQIPKNPGSCAMVVYIAGDTLHHQPMGAGHMSVLQLRGPMGFRTLQWCHPMPVQEKRTSYCTRMITIYSARKWIQARAKAENITGSQFYWRSFFLPVGNITGGQFTGGQYYYTMISIKENKVKVMTL